MVQKNITYILFIIRNIFINLFYSLQFKWNLFLQERRLAQRKIEDLHDEIVDKEKEIEQLKYKLKSKIDELEREKHERAEEVMVLTQEIENLKYMKNAAINQFDERNDLLKQMEIIKKVNRIFNLSISSYLSPCTNTLLSFGRLCIHLRISQFYLFTFNIRP